MIYLERTNKRVDRSFHREANIQDLQNRTKLYGKKLIEDIINKGDKRHQREADKRLKNPYEYSTEKLMEDIRERVD